ncbi:MAG: pyruvate carboxyltransferase [bacterium]|nr:pyruvate carboxyltransferase [bacterium]
MINGLTIFDCSMREIGYQTGWNFTEKTAKDIYNFAQTRGIDYVELGFFHDEAADPNRGIYRYCSLKNEAIAQVFQSSKNITKLAAMRDIQRPLSPLMPAKESIIDTVRLLTRSPETNLDVLDRFATEAMELGYEVFLNFTSAGRNPIELNIQFAEFAKAKGVHAIEFADTESVMTTQYVQDTIRECHKVGIKMGCHFHNRNGTAEGLADCAIAAGADYMDVTHIGLGGKWRDGNVTMEYLLRKLNVDAGYEATIVKNEIIEDLINYHEYTAAV